ncbi:hypothetical protein [uncultured Pigmentiphaga sp.]|uniref:hypothetical protein n=1 Tax=uncultured Pigmentiphaga sp. TaxID=340361 RepID=UPI0026381696|nr:hypothetical protein [uncultured Pigmentiphaga sp.]
MPRGIPIVDLDLLEVLTREYSVPMQRPGDPAGRATIEQVLALVAAAQEIQPGSDFDDLGTPGLYILTSDANAPFTGGRWFVRVRSDPVDHTAIVQEAVPLTGGTGPTPFSRRAAAGVFGAWISSGAPDASGVPYDDSTAFPGATNVQEALEAAADPWASLPLRVPIPVFDHLGGGAPPTDKWYRYVKLSAGETGPGGYNEGILTNEIVEGTAPLIYASAVINLPASPVHWQAVRLINTERRFLRAGSSGTTQDDAIQNHTHSQIRDNAYGGGAGGPTNFFWGSTSSSTGGVNSGRVDNETRPRNVGVTYYMRIL